MALMGRISSRRRDRLFVSHILKPLYRSRFYARLRCVGFGLFRLWLANFSVRSLLSLRHRITPISDYLENARIQHARSWFR